MRILMVVRPCQGGILSHVNTLISGLVRAGHQIFVAGLPTPVNQLAEGFFYLPWSNNPWRLWSSGRMLQSLIYELSPDVVHFQGALAATLGWTIPKGRAIWVYTAHNFPSVGASGWWRQDGIIAKKMDAVIAVSRSLADVLIQKGVSKEKITVIPNGIDLDRFVPQPLRYSPDAPVLLAMGRLVPEKGFAYL
ncbi:MAG: glycosyltransferase family 4 protein, partial [Firmicutes bacterium]|nr:glycosyltransferase family 4 protein [Bacillota bacterium]